MRNLKKSNQHLNIDLMCAKTVQSETRRKGMVTLCNGCVSLMFPIERRRSEVDKNSYLNKKFFLKKDRTGSCRH